MQKGNEATDTSSVVVKAHMSVTKAEEALANGQLEQAMQLHHQAAELFLMATNHTSDLESIKALQLLSVAQSTKAHELERQLQMFNAKPSLPIKKSEPLPVNKSNNQQTGSSPPSTSSSLSSASSTSSSPNRAHSGESPTGTNDFSEDIRKKLETVSVSKDSEEPYGLHSIDLITGSQSHFVGQTPSSSTHEILLYGPTVSSNNNTTNTNQVGRELNTDYGIHMLPLSDDTPAEVKTSSDLWSWMEKMLDILPIPTFGAAQSNQKKSHDEPLHESSLLSSFYMVPSRAAPEAQKPSHHTLQTTSDSSASPEVIKQMELEIKQLRQTVDILTNENARLKQLCEKGVQVSKENEVMKKSILLFRNEFQKKANQLRESSIWTQHQSSSVGHLPALLNSELKPGSQSTASVSSGQRDRVQELESRIFELMKQLNTISNTCSAQQKMIEKYEKRWAKLKDEARRRRKASNPADSTASIQDSVEYLVSNPSKTTDSSSSLYYSTDLTQANSIPNIADIKPKN